MVTGPSRGVSKYLDKAKKQDWWDDAWVKTLAGDFTLAQDLSFQARAEVHDVLSDLSFTPDLSKMLYNNQDFRGGEMYDAVAVVQLSKHKLDSDQERVFAIYTGNDPEQAMAMSPNEVKVRDQFLADPNFRVHEAYDWIMLGPENPDMFFLEKPIDPVEWAPSFAQDHQVRWMQKVSRMESQLLKTYGRTEAKPRDKKAVKEKFNKFLTEKGKTPLPQQDRRYIIGAMKRATLPLLIK